jgi:hypothetical protein
MAEKQNYERIYDLESIKKTRDLEKYISQHKENMTKYEWLLITKSNGFTLDIAERYPEHIDWQYLCAFHKLPINFMEKYFDYLDIYSISALQVLTYKFIEKYKERLSMDKIIENKSARNMSRFPEIKEIYKNMSKQKKYIKLWKSYKENSMFKSSKRKIATPKLANAESEKSKLKKDDLEQMKKSELQKILEDMQIGYYYKNTVPELIEKILSKQERTDFNENDLDGIKKSVLYDILEERGVKIYYHDTIDELKQKVLDSNPK